MDRIVYKNLTRMMSLLQFEHQMFYAEFVEARNIIDQRGPSRNNTPNPSEDSESPPLSETDDSA